MSVSEVSEVSEVFGEGDSHVSDVSDDSEKKVSICFRTANGDSCNGKCGHSHNPSVIAKALKRIHKKQKENLERGHFCTNPDCKFGNCCLFPHNAKQNRNPKRRVAENDSSSLDEVDTSVVKKVSGKKQVSGKKLVSEKKPCIHFLHGKCPYGQTCHFSHEKKPESESNPRPHIVKEVTPIICPLDRNCKEIVCPHAHPNGRKVTTFFQENIMKIMMAIGNSEQ